MKACDVSMRDLNRRVRSEGRDWDRGMVNNAKEALLNMRGFVQYKREHLPSA